MTGRTELLKPGGAYVAAEKYYSFEMDLKLYGLDRAIELFMLRRLVEELKRCGGNQSQAAENLKMPRSTLTSRLIKQHGLELLGA